jgi:hypothetical protein
MRYIFSISGHSQIEPMTRLRSIPLNLSKFPPVVGWQSMLFQLLLNRPWLVQPFKTSNKQSLFRAVHPQSIAVDLVLSGLGVVVQPGRALCEWDGDR